MPNGQPTSSWSATAFSPVFGKSAARLPAGLPYRTIFLLPTATEDRLGAELWGAKPAVPNIPFKTKERATTFFAKAKEKNSTDIAPKNPNQAIVSIDNDDFPLPIPLVKRKGKWYFDTKAGRQEILNRRIGASELTPLRCVAALWKHRGVRSGKA
jgi:hypothetical protein